MSQPISRSSTLRWLKTLSIAVVCLVLTVAPASAQLIRDGNVFVTLASPGVPGAPATHDTFGRAFAVGDFDNDGFDDLATGAPADIFAAPTPNRPGKVVVFYGSQTGFDPSRTQQLGQGPCDGQPNCLDLAGEAEANEAFGFSLAAGDFNGDSYDDLAIGAPWAQMQAGEVTVAFGGAAGLTAEDSQLWDQGNDDLTGQAEAQDGFGYALTANDFNGDTYDDLAIGLPGEDVNVEGADINDAGAVIVLYGSMTVGLSALNHQFWSQSNNVEGDATALTILGASLTSADFNSDGYYDLAIGAPLAEVDGTAGAGRVHEIHGSVGEGLDAGSQDTWERVPGQEGAQLGSTLAAGDFNNDGYDDIVFGIPFEDFPASEDAGITDILFGSPGGITDEGFQHLSEGDPPLAAASNGPQVDDLAGYALTAGDFNGDGFDDLAQAIPGQTVNGSPGAGAIRILPGTGLRGPFAAIGGVTTMNLQLFTQGNNGIVENPEAADLVGLPWPNEPRPAASRFGNVFAAGDFNGDGFDDLVAGVPLEDLTDPDTGLIVNAGGFHIIFGSRQPPPDLQQKINDLNTVIGEIDAAVP